MNHPFCPESPVSPKLSKLRPVLKGWSWAVAKYRRESEDWDPWHYRERTWVGFLAAGAWHAKGVALEEWRTDKRKSNGQKSKGRADLYIGIGKENFDFEAKHGWWKIKGGDFGVSHVEQLKQQAMESARALMMKKSTRVAAVFASIDFSKALTDAEGRKREFDRALDKVVKQLEPDARAYMVEFDRKHGGVSGVALFLWEYHPKA